MMAAERPEMTRTKTAKDKDAKAKAKLANFNDEVALIRDQQPAPPPQD